MLGVGLFDFKRQYVSYAEYHVNPVNKAIHTVFVPTLLWTAFVMTAVKNPQVMWSVAGGYAAYYTILHPVIGGSAALATLAGAYGAMEFVKHGLEWTGVEPFNFALGLHISSWLIQFVGHAIEGRAPAFLDNVFQPIVLAPFFVWSHGLFDLGLYKNLSKELDAETAKKVAAFRAKKE
ncbi:hypothetical protein BC830DRAFT_1122412 [Chytriomyces sp. MP71]|nr:hypothetical protein BC830DRAFT_1122412 [Chytriomyces sp. MP71]